LAGYSKHKLFWEGVDSVPLDTILKYGNLLAESKLVREEWFTLVQLLQCSDWWTEKQRRRVVLTIIKHWDDLSVLLELAD
jgi:hypothetical protein